MRRILNLTLGLALFSTGLARPAAGGPTSVEFAPPNLDPGSGTVRVEGRILEPGWRLIIGNEYVTSRSDKTFDVQLPAPSTPANPAGEIYWYAVSHTGEVQKGSLRLVGRVPHPPAPTPTEWRLAFRLGLAPHHSLAFSTQQLGDYQSAGSQPLAAEAVAGLDWAISGAGRWRLQTQWSFFHQASIFGSPNLTTSSGALVLPSQEKTRTSYLDAGFRISREEIDLSSRLPLKLSIGCEYRISSSLTEATYPIGYGTAHFVGTPLGLSVAWPHQKAPGLLAFEATPLLSLRPWNGLLLNGLQLRLHWKPERLLGASPPLGAQSWYLGITRSTFSLSTAHTGGDEVSRHSIAAWFGIDW